jgi:hypothetical protein
MSSFKRLISFSLFVLLFVSNQTQQSNIDINTQKQLQWLRSWSGAAILKCKDIVTHPVAGCTYKSCTHKLVTLIIRY